MANKDEDEESLEKSDINENESEDEEPEQLEEEIKQAEQEQDFEDFTDFIITGAAERTAPTLQDSDSLQEIPDTATIEEIAETAPLHQTNEEQPLYVTNAPDYAGSEDYAETRQQETRTADIQMDVTRGGLMLREQEVMNPHTRNINLQNWQETEMQETRHQAREDDYVSRLKRKKDEDKLPFQ